MSRTVPMASFYHHFLCFLLVQLPLFTSAQSSNNITLGSSVSTHDESPYWTSPSGEFAFGFHPQRDVFLLAIWFEKIPLKTIVWTANDGQPVQKGATVQLTFTGVLSLRTPNGTEIWKAQAMDNSEIAYAALLNTGNFVLISTESATAWGSFGDPTDTMLPTQTLERGSKLTSRLTADDYSIGKFELSLQTDGNLVLYTMARPASNNNRAYWASDTMNNGSRLVFNQTGYVYLALKDGNMIYPSSTRPDSSSVYYQRAILDLDGVFRQYTYPRTLPSNGTWPESWSISWSLPENICTTAFGEYGSGACGFNSYCKGGENQRAECECPPGYTYTDPNNTFGGCIPNFVPQVCGKNSLRISEEYQIRVLFGVDWPGDDYEWFHAVNEDWCSERCLNDCFCAVAIIYDNRCSLKTFPLSLGRMDPSFSGKALVKVGNLSIEDVPSTVFLGNKGKGNKGILTFSIILGISVLLNLLFLSLVFPTRKQNEKHKATPTSDVNLRLFTYKELEDATDGFKFELGKGAFSTVYKGVLKSDSGRLVAVKRLEKVVQGNNKEFKAEVSTIGKTNHKNLVKLLGFCDEDAHQLLVYEFMENGSLEHFLFGSSWLAWNQRIQIACGIARGLAYLHEDCSSQIIHCDVKPQNILLDDSYSARISDFGLAKLMKSEQTRTTTGIRGTRGYVAPEWFKNMAITAKVDVYSFGVMLLELICCRKNVEFQVGEEELEILSDFAYECFLQKSLHLLVVNDEEAKNDGKNLERLLMISLWCIQEEPAIRPSMKEVNQMLEGAVEVFMPPTPSSFMSSIG